MNPFLNERFIGRQSSIDQIKKIIDSPDAKRQIIFLQGQGGMGKTMLLKELAAQAKKQNLLTTEPIDLYNREFHSFHGLASAIAKDLVSNHNIQVAAYPIPESSTFHSSFAKYFQERTEQSFFDGLKQISTDRQLVLLFDTFEALGTSLNIPIEDDKHVRPAWNRLIECIKSLERVTVLVSGRPYQNDQSVIDELSSDGWLVNKINLGGFDLRETQEYFRARAEIKDFSVQKDAVEKIHAVTDGRPLLLALAAEWLYTSEEFDASIENSSVSTVTAFRRQPGLGLKKIEETSHSWLELSSNTENLRSVLGLISTERFDDKSDRYSSGIDQQILFLCYKGNSERQKAKRFLFYENYLVPAFSYLEQDTEFKRIISSLTKVYRQEIQVYERLYISAFKRINEVFSSFPDIQSIKKQPTLKVKPRYIPLLVGKNISGNSLHYLWARPPSYEKDGIGRKDVFSKPMSRPGFESLSALEMTNG